MCVWPVVIVCALRDASPVTPPTKMTSLATWVSHGSVVEHSNWQSREAMGSIPVGDSENLFSRVGFTRLILKLFITTHPMLLIFLTLHEINFLPSAFILTKHLSF